MFTFPFLPFVTVFIVTFTLLAVQIQSRHNYRRACKSYGCAPLFHENAWDVFGIVKAIRLSNHFRSRSVLEYTRELFRRHGDTYTSTIAGREIVFTCDPVTIKHVLSTGFWDFNVAATRRHLFQPVTPHGILTLDGPQWKLSRGLFRAQFMNTRLLSDLDRLELHVQEFIDHIPPNTGPVDIQQLFSQLVLDTTSELVLGESLGALCRDPDRRPAEKRQFADALRYIKDTIASKGFLGPLHQLVGRSRFHDAGRSLRQFVGRRVREAIEHGKRKQPPSSTDPTAVEGRYSFIKGLTLDTHCHETLCDHALDILLAGTDSVSALLSAMFYFLARDERVFLNLRSSIIQALGHDPPSFQQLKSLTYLRFVMNESLRLLPPVPFDARTANKDIILPSGGKSDGASKLLVPQGRMVVFSSFCSHRRVQTYGDNVNEFLPERWEQLSVDPPGFIPFNSGPRACPGQQYALIEASYITVRILQAFSRLKNWDARFWTERISLVLENRNGVVIGLSRD